jgi:hypothetical protein
VCVREGEKERETWGVFGRRKRGSWYDRANEIISMTLVVVE